MGLDNGIMIRGKRHLELNLPYPAWDWGSRDLEICYWRKFWGFRNEMVQRFHQKEECADIPLLVDDLQEVIEILENYLDRDYYEMNADSVWTYEEYLVRIIHDIENIQELIRYMNENHDVICYFYDSY